MTSDLIKSNGKNCYRSLFLSDFHLGSLNCKAKRLYDFIQDHTADRIYLVGDIVEGHHLSRWPLYHDMVIGLLASRGQAGTEIIYIPGNHDAIFRKHFGTYGALKVAPRALHQGVDGRTFLVTHGDETDRINLGPLLIPIVLIERLTGISTWNWARTLLGKWIARHVGGFEIKMRAKALRKYDGAICGHIHEPLITGSYMNCGDWTHHCTGIAEHFDGSFELLKG